jgi:hypothetical protein
MVLELESVQKPFIAQLQGPGWTHVAGSLDDPAVTRRVRVTPLPAPAAPIEGSV